MSDVSFTQLSAVYTPGDVRNNAGMEGGSNSYLASAATGQRTAAPKGVPIWGVAAVALVIAFLELRRRRLGGR
jgi:hypothetical protein